MEEWKFLVALVDKGQVQKKDQIRKKFSDLWFMYQKKYSYLFIGNVTVLMSLYDLLQVDVYVENDFQFNNDEASYSSDLWICPNENRMPREDLDKVLEVGIITRDSSSWFFTVVISTKKGCNPRFFVYNRSLN